MGHNCVYCGATAEAGRDPDSIEILTWSYGETIQWPWGSLASTCPRCWRRLKAERARLRDAFRAPKERRLRSVPKD